MSAAMQPFEAEVGRVLDLVINSLYQHREIFLRELISNASDACDRLRYASLTEQHLLGDDPELKIRLIPDPAAGTLTVVDNGIGMSRDELVENLGTIARSGTQRFVTELSGNSAKDVNLIGQFGVGFYSAFMVAGEVEVISRKAGEEHSWRWHSDGHSGFAVEERAESAPRGTAVILHLREDAKEFLDGFRLRQIARSYSDHIAVPILLQGEAKADGETQEDAAEPKAPEQINQASALWTRPKAEITDEQYKEFYHHVAHAFDDPWARLHVQAEGMVVLSGAAVRSELAPVRSLRPGASPGRQALRQARVHHRRSRRSDAALSALRPGRGQFRGSAAQRLARDPPAQRRAGPHPQGSGQAPARRARPARQGRGRRLCDLRRPVRGGAQGGPVRGSRAARAAPGAGPVSAAPRATAGSAWPTTSAA